MKLVIFAMTFSLGGAWALDCGSHVSGMVTLTQDLHCTLDKPGLLVVADNTMINLNGHTIDCHGTGFLGSCQGQSGVTLPYPAAGVYSKGHSHITVLGPGSLYGFTYGVELQAGEDLVVQNVSVTGPAAGPADNRRSLAIGIWMRDISCPASNRREPVAAKVLQNSVADQVTGILLSNSSCVLVQGNRTTDNNAGAGYAHGIAVAAGGHNMIAGNGVTGNGSSLAGDSGIYLTHDVINGAIVPTEHNLLHRNTVDSNCGDGIVTGQHTNDNNIYQNTAKFNGCVPTHPGFDLADLGGTGNIWNPNNTCRTQNANIPAGVCNPWE